MNSRILSVICGAVGVLWLGRCDRVAVAGGITEAQGNTIIDYLSGPYGGGGATVGVVDVASDIETHAGEIRNTVDLMYGKVNAADLFWFGEGSNGWANGSGYGGGNTQLAEYLKFMAFVLHGHEDYWTTGGGAGTGALSQPLIQRVKSIQDAMINLSTIVGHVDGVETWLSTLHSKLNTIDIGNLAEIKAALRTALPNSEGGYSYVQKGLITPGGVAYLDNVYQKMLTLESYLSAITGGLETPTGLADLLQVLEDIEVNTGLDGVLLDQLEAMTAILSTLNTSADNIETSTANLSQIRTTLSAWKTSWDTTIVGSGGLTADVEDLKRGLWDAGKIIDDVEAMKLRLDQIYDAGGIRDCIVSLKAQVEQFRTEQFPAFQTQLFTTLDALAIDVSEIAEWEAYLSHLPTIAGDLADVKTNTATMAAIMAAWTDGAAGNFTGLTVTATGDFEVPYAEAGAGLDAALDDKVVPGFAFPAYTGPMDASSVEGAPVWEFHLPISTWFAGWGPGAQDIDLELDWSFWQPYRGLAWSVMIFGWTLVCMKTVWEELRKYG